MIRLSQLGILTESTEFNRFLVKSLPKMVSGIGLSARGVEADMIWLSRTRLGQYFEPWLQWLWLYADSYVLFAFCLLRSKWSLYHF